MRILNGVGGYKPKEYGKFITIKRTISRPSGGGLQLLAEDGTTVVSRDRKEVRQNDVVYICMPSAMLDPQPLVVSASVSLFCICLPSQLDKILDHLNVQVENPCVVLDQENSKKFLKGSETEKYQFFLRATDLVSASP